MKYCSNTMIIRTAWLYSTFGNNFVKTMIRLGKEKEALGVILIRLELLLMRVIWLLLFLQLSIKVLFQVYIII